MSASRQVAVLIVDDEPAPRLHIRKSFLDRNQPQDEYMFSVSTASTIRECVELLRKQAFDVLVLDVMLADDDWKGGLHLALLTHIQSELGWKAPIRIVVTGVPSFDSCVQAVRAGVWDYIRKESRGSKHYPDIVVDSAVQRLRELDYRRSLKSRINEEWLPKHHRELEREYPGKVIALWGETEIEIIASGDDVFALYDALKSWNDTREPWQAPELLRLPPNGDAEVDE